MLDDTKSTLEKISKDHDLPANIRSDADILLKSIEEVFSDAQILINLANESLRTSK